MKKFKYTELSNKAQIKARKEYLQGWLDSRDDQDDIIDDCDIHSILTYDLVDELYDEQGNCIEIDYKLGDDADE